MKEEVVKELESIVMEGIQMRIENAIESAQIKPSSSSNEALSIPELEKSFSDRMDDTELTAKTLAEKVDNLSDSVTKWSTETALATESIGRWQQWKDSGVISTKEDWLLGVWGLQCLQVRFLS